MTRDSAASQIPLGLKVGFTLWVAVWAPVYLVVHDWRNFLWFCDTANLVLVVALWLESRLLVSSQAVGILLVGFLWGVDLLAALVSGAHPIGGTEYMFDPGIPLGVRLLSLFHIAVPLLLVWLVRRIGFDRRGIAVQTLIAWVLLPASYLAAGPERNLNWVYGPFGGPQELVAPLGYLLFSMIAYPLVVFLPTHLVLTFLQSRASRR